RPHGRGGARKGPPRTSGAGRDMTSHRTFALLAIVAAVGCSMAQAPTPPTASDHASHDQHASHAARPADAQPVLYDSFGTHSYPITTSAANAQRWGSIRGSGWSTPSTTRRR